MCALKVPKKQAEKPQQDRLFPAGVWMMELEEVRMKGAPDFMLRVPESGKAPQVGNGDNEVTGVQFGGAVALEDGQDEAGKMKFFQDFVTRDGGVGIMDGVQDISLAGCGWRVQGDGKWFTNLALAIGAVIDYGSDVAPTDDFLDKLQAGEFKGYKVVLEVRHREWVSKAGKSGVSAELVAFSPGA